MDRDISPPPLKRRKVETLNTDSAEVLNDEGREFSKPEDISSPDFCRIRIFSWNINGIQAFLPAPEPPITTFFKPIVEPGKASSRARSGSKGSEAQVAGRGNPLRAFLQRHGWPEVLFLQELKISPLDEKTPASLLSAINKSTGPQDSLSSRTRYTVNLNLPRDKHNARGFGGKLYGVGTLLREDFASQHVADIRHAEWDLEGRVTIVELQSTARDTTSSTIEALDDDSNPSQHHRRPLALLNVYAVNGTTAPYRSPDTGKPAGTRHDHKLAFHARLRDECLDLERRGFSVVVAGDVNIARGRLDGHPNLRTFPRQHCVNRVDFNSKFFGEEDNVRAEAYLGEQPRGREGDEARFDGVDVFRALKGPQRRYTYHPRGGDEWGSSCDRVDFIIVSKTLYDSGRVVGTDILDTPQERGTSDHVPLWVDLDMG